MGFFDAISACFSNYATFSGRARRSEYWFWYLFCVILSFVSSMFMVVSESIAVMMSLFYLVLLLPSLSVTVRRLHDTGKSGWAMFVSLIPIVGGIILLVWLCSDSKSGNNKYGSCPK